MCWRGRGFDHTAVHQRAQLWKLLPTLARSILCPGQVMFVKFRLAYWWLTAKLFYINTFLDKISCNKVDPHRNYCFIGKTIFFLDFWNRIWSPFGQVERWEPPLEQVKMHNKRELLPGSQGFSSPSENSHHWCPGDFWTSEKHHQGVRVFFELWRTATRKSGYFLDVRKSSPESRDIFLTLENCY